LWPVRVDEVTGTQAQSHLKAYFEDVALATSLSRAQTRLNVVYVILIRGHE